MSLDTSKQIDLIFFNAQSGYMHMEVSSSFIYAFSFQSFFISVTKDAFWSRALGSPTEGLYEDENLTLVSVEAGACLKLIMW